MEEQYRFQVVHVEGIGRGILRQEHAHYSIVEFGVAGHLWTLAVEKEDYEIVDEINISHEEIT